IMPIVRQYYHMLQKNIIYTGITRAKESPVLCGEEDSFIEAIHSEGRKRKTLLAEYLTKILKGDTKEDVESSNSEVNYTLTMDLVLTKKIDPMINMEGISPFDFN